MMLGETQTDLATAIVDWFSADHFTVQVETNGLHVLECLRENHYDVIILEIALPGLDGISVARSCRAGGVTTPLVLMAARQSSDSLRSGLDAGADSVVVKPFHLSDLAAQVRALLRRPAMRPEEVLRIGDIAMDTGAGTVTKNDLQIHLLPMEFKLLHFFLCHPNQVFSARAIFERVWRKRDGSLEDTVRTHIRTLRMKIDSVGTKSIITTVRGQGYKTDVR